MSHDDYDSDYMDFDDNSQEDITAPTQVYETEYKTITITQVWELLNNETKSLEPILNLSTSLIIELLTVYNFNHDKLLEAYTYSDNSDTILHKLGLDKYDLEVSIEWKQEFSCFICCYNKDQYVVILPCGHEICLDCMKRYLKGKIEEREIKSIKCAGNCGLILSPSNIKAILLHPTHLEEDNRDMEEKWVDRYENCLIENYVQYKKELKFCPNPNCNKIIYYTSAATDGQQDHVIPSVKCECGYSFCFRCNEEEHLPCLCKLVKRWLQKCSDDSETSNYLMAHTKECTKCLSVIEKNGGCNHMTCKKCKYEFCWVCMGPWTIHGQSWYNCSKFDEKQSKDNRDKQSQSRYYNRYINHYESSKLEKQLYDNIRNKMSLIQESGTFSWIEVQFLEKAMDDLLLCRHTLRWTYAFAYYLIPNNMTEIFENNQKDLELSVEALSELLERPTDFENLRVLKCEVLDMAYYVFKRREVLLIDTIQGLKEDRWSFDWNL